MVRPAGFEQRVFVLVTATPTAPTAAQILAGVEITSDLPAPINFSGTTNFIDVSDISDRQDKQQVGTISIDNLEFEIYRHKAALQLAYDALDNETDYYILKFEGGSIAASGGEGAPAAGDHCDIAQVTVGIKSDVTSPRNDSRRMKVPVGVREAIRWGVAVV